MKAEANFFCKSCNLVIDHHREFVIKRHIDSKVCTLNNLLFIGINLNQRHRCNCKYSFMFTRSN